MTDLLTETRIQPTNQLLSWRIPEALVRLQFTVCVCCGLMDHVEVCFSCESWRDCFPSSRASTRLDGFFFLVFFAKTVFSASTHQISSTESIMFSLGTRGGCVGVGGL